MGIFNYEGKFQQGLLVIADYFILNALFLLCCIPIFTIGAAQAGLYSGLRVLKDPDDDSSVIKAFFKGFRNGFLKITVIWTVFLLIMVIVSWNLFAVLFFDLAGFDAPFWMSMASVIILAIYLSMLTPFHSQFDCTPFQLIRSTFFFTLGHPIKAIGITFFTWLPLIAFCVNFVGFMSVMPGWMTFYFSVTFGINVSFLKKPYEKIMQSFVENYEKENGEIVIEEAENK